MNVIIIKEFDKNSAHKISKALLVLTFQTREIQTQIGSAKFFDFFFHLIMPF